MQLFFVCVGVSDLGIYEKHLLERQSSAEDLRSVFFNQHLGLKNGKKELTFTQNELIFTTFELFFTLFRREAPKKTKTKFLT